MNDSNIRQMQKRKKKTCDEQYEIYLSTLERDCCLNSGIFNPKLDEIYQKSWESLKDKLNCVGHGPQLTVEEWRRRFRDWKNLTAQKYRRMLSHQNQNGDGPSTKIRMTANEERWLSVWRKTTYNGCSGIIDLSFNDPGMKLESEGPSDTDANSSDTGDVVLLDPASAVSVNFHEDVEISIPAEQTRFPLNQSPEILSRNESHNIPHVPNTKNNKIIKKSRKLVRPGKFSRLYLQTKKLKLKLEAIKLKFEIEKYKFENPSFDFNLDLLSEFL